MPLAARDAPDGLEPALEDAGPDAVDAGGRVDDRDPDQAAAELAAEVAVDQAEDAGRDEAAAGGLTAERHSPSRQDGARSGQSRSSPQRTVGWGHAATMTHRPAARRGA